MSFRSASNGLRIQEVKQSRFREIATNALGAQQNALSDVQAALVVHRCRLDALEAIAARTLIGRLRWLFAGK